MTDLVLDSGTRVRELGRRSQLVITLVYTSIASSTVQGCAADAVSSGFPGNGGHSFAQLGEILGEWHASVISGPVSV